MQLNKWLSADKPKKDDFNNDNQKIDEAYRLLAESIGQLEASQSDGASQQAVTTLSNSLNAHSSNTQIHVTQAEKDAWSSGAGFIMGSYTGTDESPRVIELGFQPRFGIIFASGNGIARVAWSGSQFHTYCGCISTLGCSQGLALTSSGFSVSQSSSSPDGFLCKFNVLGTQYVYLLMK